jgi:biotin transport system substrate-specific component
MRTAALESVVRGLGREVVVGRRAVAAIGVGATVICLALAAEARLYLPFTPVPITLQTLFVLVAGAGLGPRLGTVALSSYLALGTLGLPIFTGVWLGPTTGYLVGFVVAGWLIGSITRRAPQASARRIALAMLAGTVCIYVLGGAYYAGWLGVACGVPLGLAVPRAVAEGVVPFLVGDAAKLVGAAAFCRSYRDRLLVLFP